MTKTEQAHEMIAEYRKVADKLDRLPTSSEMYQETGITNQEFTSTLSEKQSWASAAKVVCDRLGRDYYNANTVERAEYLLDTVAEELALPDMVKQLARVLIIEYVKSDRMHGSYTENVVGGAVKVACNKENVVRSSDRIRQALQTAIEVEADDDNRDEQKDEYVENLSGRYRAVMDATGMTTLPPTVDKHIEFIASEINDPAVVERHLIPRDLYVSKAVVERAKQIAEEYDSGSSSPSARAAGVIYSVAEASGLDLKQKYLAIATDKTVMTIRNNTFDNVPNEELAVNAADLIPSGEERDTEVPGAVAERAAEVVGNLDGMVWDGSGNGDDDPDPMRPAYRAAAATFAVANASSVDLTTAEIDSLVKPRKTLEANYDAAEVLAALGRDRDDLAVSVEA